MPVVSYNSVGGYSTGLTMTGVIDSLGNITGVGATFSGLIRANAGISSAGGTFANDIAVNSMTIGRGTANLPSNIAIGASAYFSGTTGVNNVAIGLNALRLNQAGDINTAIGAGALQSNVNGRNNVALGWSALNTLNTATWGSGQAEYNVAIGGNALGAATTATNNIGIGAAAAQALTTGAGNISIGTFTSLRNGSGSDNVAIGNQAMVGSGSLTSQNYNTSIGANSSFNITNANYNTAIGHSTAFSSTSGSFNSVIGAFALYHATTLANSVALGYQAGRFAGITGGSNLTSSTNSVYIGTDSKSGFTTSSNEIVIGVNAVGLGSNTTVIGATSTTSATIYGVLNATSGISSSGGITLNGYLTGSTGFLFGPTSAFLQFVPTTPNTGGLHLRNGIFQVGQSSIGFGAGFLNVDGNAERMVFNGRTEMYVNAGYQAAQSAYSIAIGSGHSGDPIRIAKQDSIGSIDATKVIAGCNVNGIWYGAGFSGGTGGIRSSGGFTFGSPSGTTFMVFIPQTSCSNGGLWIRDGNIQVGGSAPGSGNFFYSPCGERFDVYGYATFNNSYNYQAGRAVLRLNGAPTQSVPILAAYKQTSDGTQLTTTFTTTNMVAGIDQNGALFSSVGISAGGGVTFAGTLKGVTASFTGLLSASSGISASNATFSSDVYANASLFTDNIFDNNGIVSINDKTNSRVAIGDYSSNANSTWIYLRDNLSILDLSNPFGVIKLGDPNSIDNGNYITYDTPNATFSGNGQNNLDGFQTISADATILENNRRVTTNARSWFL